MNRKYYYLNRLSIRSMKIENSKKSKKKSLPIKVNGKQSVSNDITDFLIPAHYVYPIVKTRQKPMHHTLTQCNSRKAALVP